VCFTEKKEPEAEKISHHKDHELAPPPEKKMVGHEEGRMLEDQVKTLEERLLRLQAEFENYKKRAERENETLKRNAGADVLLKLLPIVDEFEIAVSHMDKASHKEFRHGIELIFVKLVDMLRKEGVDEMKAMGETFDPYKHDAIRQAAGAEGKVVEVIQKGYSFRGKVLRHAKVAVGNGEKKGDEVD
jgi:molecular chaperone GrpE